MNRYSNEERLALHDAVKSFVSQGQSARLACAMVRIPFSTYCSWQRKEKRDGGLIDGRTDRSGRTPALCLTPDETTALRRCRHEKQTLTAALLCFALDAACLPATREYILTHHAAAEAAGSPIRWPMSLQRAASIKHEIL